MKLRRPCILIGLLKPHCGAVHLVIVLPKGSGTDVDVKHEYVGERSGGGETQGRETCTPGSQSEKKKSTEELREEIVQDKPKHDKRLRLTMPTKCLISCQRRLTVSCGYHRERRRLGYLLISVLSSSPYQSLTRAVSDVLGIGEWNLASPRDVTPAP